MSTSSVVFWGSVVTPSDILTIGLLVALEGLLSADNAMVLAVLVLGLPKSQQKKALRYGIGGAFAFRTIAVLLAAWEIACRALQVPVYFLAPPSAIAASLAADAPALLKATGYTLAEALGALVIASLLAQALALTVALSPLLERAVKPLTVVLQVTPVIAIAPLVNIWAGTDHPGRAVISLATLVAFFPIYSGAVTGLRATDPDLTRLFDL